MTVNNENRVAGPFTATGALQALPFTFRIFNANDVVVVTTDLAGVDTSATNQTGFTVTMNADQNVSPGGTVNITSTLNYKLTLTTALTNTQPAQLSNNGGFYPNVINDALDRLTVLVQQAVNAASRSLKIPVSDGTSILTSLPGALIRANKVLAFDSIGNLTVATTDSSNVAQSAANALAAQQAQAAAEAAAAGMKWRPTVRFATVANDTLSGLAVRNGITPVAGDRVLVLNQSAPAQNGVYLAAAGAWTRALDADTWAELVGQVVVTEEASTIAGTTDVPYICTVNAGGTIGVTAVTWVVLPSPIGNSTITTAMLAAQTLLDIRQIPQTSQSANYAFALSDAGTQVKHPSADVTGRTWTIPANASVAFPIGAAITLINQNGAGAITLAITSDTLRLAGAGTTGSRTIAANGVATIIKTDTTEWYISGSGVT